MKAHLCALVHDATSPVPKTIALDTPVLVWHATEVREFKEGVRVGMWLAGKVSKLPGSIIRVGDKDMMV